MIEHGKQLIDLTIRLAAFTEAPQELRLTSNDWIALKLSISPAESMTLLRDADRSAGVLGHLNGVKLVEA